MVIHFELSIPSSSAAIWLIRGVARLKVVAVPASRANTAIKSMIFPGALSVRLPSRGRQASENFCLWQPRTWSINPKDTARIR